MNEPAWHIADGELWVEQRSCRSLAEEFATPLYVISEGRLRDNARRLTAALQAAWPHGPARLLASIKANPTLATRRILSQEGLGCDTFGETELVLALRAGVDPALISVNGAVKSPALIERAIEVGARLTLDSADELDLVESIARRRGTPAVVRLRVRPRLDGLDQPSNLTDVPMSVRDAALGYKAGIPLNDLVATGRRACGSPWIRLAGLHTHLGRHSADPQVWRASAGSFVELVAELHEALDGWLPEELDVGGGWPSAGDPPSRRPPAQRHRDAPLPAEDYATLVATAVADALVEAGLSPAGLVLEAEPGRALYADAGLHLARVTHVKRQTDPRPHTWVETDTSEAFLPDTHLEQALFTPAAVTGADRPQTLRADVTGVSCGFDVIAPDVKLPAVCRGEVLAFLETGAYQDAGASNFNGLPRPATVLVNGADAELIKRRETIEDVLARDLVPPRLVDARSTPGRQPVIR